MNQLTQARSVQDVQLWTALVTPFLSDGTVDFDNLKALAKRQANAGNGITLLGSTGEGLALTQAEQFAIVETVCDLSLNVPIMVAVGGYNLATQLAWMAKCNQLNISAYLLASPIYAKPGVVGLTEWFSALLAQSQHPCMIYNVPSRSGVNIPYQAIQNVQHHEHCWAIKEASGDLNTLLSYRQHCPDVALYSGEDAMMPYLAAAEVKGLVSVAANVWPEATSQYLEFALSGQHQGLFPLWQNAVDTLFQVASPIPVKVLMNQKGMLSHAKLRAPLTENELAANNGLAEVDQQISQWLAGDKQQNQQQMIGVK